MPLLLSHNGFPCCVNTALSALMIRQAHQHLRSNLLRSQCVLNLISLNAVNTACCIIANWDAIHFLERKFISIIYSCLSSGGWGGFWTTHKCSSYCPQVFFWNCMSWLWYLCKTLTHARALLSSVISWYDGKDYDLSLSDIDFFRSVTGSLDPRDIPDVQSRFNCSADLSFDRHFRNQRSAFESGRMNLPYALLLRWSPMSGASCLQSLDDRNVFISFSGSIFKRQRLGRVFCLPRCIFIFFFFVWRRCWPPPRRCYQIPTVSKRKILSGILIVSWQNHRFISVSTGNLLIIAI